MRCVAILLIFLSSPSLMAAQDFAISAMAHINGALMASPLLPRLFAKKKQSEIQIRPIMFEASNEESRGFDPKIVDYSGSGGAVFYYKRLGSSFGYFAQLSGNSISGNFTGPGSDPSDAQYTIYVNDVKSSMLQASLGMSVNLLKFSNFELQFLAAPSFSQTQLEQTVVQNDFTSPDDYDLSMNVGAMSYYAGVQMGIKMAGFVLNPYYIITDLVDEKDRCQSFSTVVRTSGNLFDIGSVSCRDQGGNLLKQIEFNTALQAVGFNLIFPFFGMGFNIFSEVGEIPFFEAVEVNMYSLSFSFNI
ncbi:MAG: hypothetical protein HOO06_08475 [Bdellovibrionaceae bacterium]|nr:hypothetical protein [Pseudobdellovibrionaceae bacterium]